MSRIVRIVLLEGRDGDEAGAATATMDLLLMKCELILGGNG